MAESASGLNGGYGSAKPRTHPDYVPITPAGSVTIHGLLSADADIDHRAQWPRRYMQLFDQYIADLGGLDLASTAKQSIIRRVVVTEIELERLENRLAKSDNPSDKLLDLYGRLGGHLRRLLESLGIERRQRDVTPNIGQIVESARRARAAKEADEDLGHDPSHDSK